MHSMKLDIKIHIQVKNICVLFSLLLVGPTYFNATSFMSSSEYFTHTSLVMYTVQKRQVKENNALSFYHSLRRWTCRFIMGFNDGHQTR